MLNAFNRAGMFALMLVLLSSVTGDTQPPNTALLNITTPTLTSRSGPAQAAVLWDSRDNAPRRDVLRTCEEFIYWILPTACHHRQLLRPETATRRLSIPDRAFN